MQVNQNHLAGFKTLRMLAAAVCATVQAAK
jgi:hypothetical protein